MCVDVNIDDEDQAMILMCYVHFQYETLWKF